MTGFHILDKKDYPHATACSAAFYQDLNLNQVIDRICALWGSDVRPLYAYFPFDRECEAYRREIYCDIKIPAVYQALCAFMNETGLLTDVRNTGEKARFQLQKDLWHLKEIQAYCHMFDTLLASLPKESLHSDGMLSLVQYLEEYTGQTSYETMKRGVSELLEEVSSFRFTVTYEDDRIQIAEGDTPADYDSFLDRAFGTNRPPLRSPFQINPSLTELEEECLHILMKKRPALFRNIEELAKTYETYADPVLMQFIQELPFYLSYRNFTLKMMDEGFSFATPSIEDEKDISASGLYDLALSCVAVKEGRSVISNDMYMGPHERMFVLTGPNQGGKTTFARSLGQMIFFAKMGLDVPAVSANVHYFSDILTHFSVEESVETGRGKLKEELIRLAPMMAENTANAFVIINELFTTAATYDAEIMGGKVIRHFIEQDCRGIYVTHLKELTHVHPQVTSLRAMLDDRQLQSFKIERSEAEDSACAANQVNKYRLTYEQLKERL